MNSYEKYFREFGKEETNCAVCLSHHAVRGKSDGENYKGKCVKQRANGTNESLMMSSSKFG